MADRETKKDWRNSPLAWFIRLLWAQESGDQGRLQQALGWLKRLGYSIELTRKRRRDGGAKGAKGKGRGHA